MRTITEAEVESFQERGLLHLSDFFSDLEKESVSRWVGELARLPDTPGKWMRYYEPGKNGSDKQLCRIENFIPYHNGLEGLFGGADFLNELTKLMGESAVLFKEKINFKLPGGGGFLPHQDAPAFTSFNQKYHITCMYCVDAATVENGCLEFAYQYDKNTMLKQAADGTVDPELVAGMRWEPFPTAAGDVVLFDSYIPHRSQTNTSQRSRTAIFLTYNRESEGMYRDEYYEHKRQVFPQDCERDPEKDYSAGAGIYNLGNPIR